MSTIGHNSGDVLNQTAQNQLKSIVERIERLLEERGEIGEQIKEVKSEAKGNGFDPPLIMALVKARAKDKEKAKERLAILELYAAALGDVELAELA